MQAYCTTDEELQEEQEALSDAERAELRALPIHEPDTYTSDSVLYQGGDYKPIILDDESTRY